MDCINNPDYNNCPPRMSDGRHFTDFRPNVYLNSELRYKSGRLTGAEYREYLTKNAVKLMNTNSQVAWKRNGCGPCKNLCLDIDGKRRPGNSTEFNENSCIPPADFFRYVGSDGTQYPMYQPPFTRATVPSGTILSNKT